MSPEVGDSASVFAVGIACALAASVLFNVGIALQAVEARATPRARSLHLSLLQTLLRRPLWILGLLLGLVGVVPQVIALGTAPFVVVQPLLAVGLLLLLWLGSRALGEPVRAREWAAVLAIVGGVVLVAFAAPPHTEAHRGGAAVVAVVAALTLPALLPLLRVRAFTSPSAVMVACGFGYAATNVAVKLVGDDLALRHWPNAAAWAIVAAVDGFAATLTNMSVFQVLPATVVVPVITAVQTFLPIALEPLFLRERAPSILEASSLLGGLAVALVGMVQLARSPAVSAFVSRAQSAS
jgi:drug/metabolite transporter (DMT)-like permease